MSDGNVILEIREQIALWYYVMRAIAIVILLVILIVVGIRMAVTTIASEKAIYKKALFDWATSLALIFLMHYIIKGVIWVNAALVDIFAGIAEDMDLDNILAAIRELAFDYDFTAGWGAVVVYIMITIQSLMFLISYVKRMLVLAFLIIISPLITITYSIDKMGDQKAQALNNWLKEFIFNVLIQPFHCVLYLAFVSIAMSALESYASIGAMLLAVLCIKFVWDGEKIVRKIFGFEQASSLAAAAASGAVLGSMINKATSAGKTASSGIKYAKNSKTGQLLKQKMGDKKSEINDKFKNTKLGGMVAERQAERETKKQEKQEKKAEKQKLKHDAKVSKEYERLKEKAGKNASNEDIRKMAEKKVAQKEEKKEKRKEEIKGFRKAVGSDAKSFVRKVATTENMAKLTAGIMAGSAMLALPDSNMFTAVMGGYAAGKHAENKVREMKSRKSENYETQLSKAWENHCATTGTDKNDKNAFSDWVETMNGEGKLDMYSQKNVGKQESDAAKKLGEANLGLNQSEINSIIAEIKKGILSSIMDGKGGYNPEEIGRKHGIDPTVLNSLVGGFAAMYNNSVIFGKTDAFDTQMEPYGYSHEDVVQEMNFNASNTNTETTTGVNIGTNENLEEVLQKYEDETSEENADDLEAKLSEIESKLNEKIQSAQSELENTIEQTGTLANNMQVEELETKIKEAMDSGVSNIEGVIRGELLKISSTANPSKDQITEIKKTITFKHEIERDREIIREHRR